VAPLQEKLSNGGGTTAPVVVQNQTIGRLSVNKKLLEDEQMLLEAVAQHLAQTVENLRLFDNTRKLAAREQLTREIADQMRAAPDVETIISTGLKELSKALGVSRTYVKLGPRLEQDE
jgi:GAF domain-containing protein